VEVVEHVALYAQAAEVTALADVGAGGDVGAAFDGGTDGEVEVLDEVGAEGDALVLLGTVLRIGVAATDEGRDVVGLGSGGHGLRIGVQGGQKACERGTQERGVEPGVAQRP
jgi:hypothetical protein